MQQGAVISKGRITVNLDVSEYQELQGLARQLNVSMAWLGRRAIKQLLERKDQRELPFPIDDGHRMET